MFSYFSKKLIILFTTVWLVSACDVSNYLTNNQEADKKQAEASLTSTETRLIQNSDRNSNPIESLKILIRQQGNGNVSYNETLINDGDLLNINYNEKLELKIVTTETDTLINAEGCGGAIKNQKYIVETLVNDCEITLIFKNNDEIQFEKITQYLTDPDQNNLLLSDLAYFSEEVKPDQESTYLDSIILNNSGVLNNAKKLSNLINAINQSSHNHVQYAQTSLIDKSNPTIGPKLFADRDCFFAYQLNNSPENAWVRIYIADLYQGKIELNPPSEYPTTVEFGYVIDDELLVDANNYWSTILPWYLVNDQLTLQIEIESLGLKWLSQRIEPTISIPRQHYWRSLNQIILWSDSEYVFDYNYKKRKHFAQDYFAITPFSQLVSADYTQALWHYIAWPNENPQRFDSYQTFNTAGVKNDTYHILKNHFTQRVMLANSGQGLKQQPMDQSSQYASANFSAFGLRKKTDGSFDNINQAGVAGGWIGWTALWGDTSGTYAHELGHNFGRSHWFTPTNSNAAYFTDKVKVEYPYNHGEMSGAAAQPFDTTRQQFRAWQRIDGGAIAGYHENGEAFGFFDYMSYQSRNTIGSTFLPYTPLTTLGIQDFLLSTPLIMRHKNQPGVFQWNPHTESYDPLNHDHLGLPVDKVGVPVMTIIGTFSTNLSAVGIQKPIYSRYGNTFKLVDDVNALPLSHPYYLVIEYETEQTEYAQIEATPTQTLQLFSLNLDLNKKPTKISLFNKADQTTPTVSQLLEHKLPDQTPLIHFMGLGINQSLPRLEWLRNCIDGQCLQDLAPIEWVLQPKLGIVHLALNTEKVDVKHHSNYSQLSLLASSGAVIAELKASRNKQNHPAKRPLNRQPTDWQLDDKEVITFYDLQVKQPIAFESVITIKDEQNTVFGMEKIAIALPNTFNSDHQITSPNNNIITENYSAPLSDSSVFYTVPSQPFANGPTEGVWSANSSPSIINVNLFNSVTQSFYQVQLSAKKNNYPMNSGLFAGNKSNFGPLSIQLIDSSELPKGHYIVDPYDSTDNFSL